MVGDTAGFAAATYHRGISVLQAPTTLLAMVDAAVGGKTAVNLPEGKNLVGAFHQPVGVLADTDTLASLPEPEYRSGLGEVAKYALLSDVVADPTGLVELLRLHTAEVVARDPVVLGDLVTRCVQIKADVIARDPEERTGVRATLNLGHTFAHALETAGGYDLTHGEAVALGLVFAGALAGGCERVGPDVVDRYQALPATLGLATEVPAGAAMDAEQAPGADAPGQEGQRRVDVRAARAERDRAGRRSARARAAVRVHVGRHRRLRKRRLGKRRLGPGRIGPRCPRSSCSRDRT